MNVLIVSLIAASLLLAILLLLPKRKYGENPKWNRPEFKKRD